MIASLKAEARSTKSEKEIRNPSSGIRKRNSKTEFRITKSERMTKLHPTNLLLIRFWRDRSDQRQR